VRVSPLAVVALKVPTTVSTGTFSVSWLLLIISWVGGSLTSVMLMVKVCSLLSPALSVTLTRML
jgi:hypothetical protein